MAKRNFQASLKNFADKLPRYWKTTIVVAGVVAALAPDLIQGIQELFADGQWSTQDTWRLVILAVTSYGVYKKTNTPPAGEPADPAVSEAESTDPRW